MLEDSPKQSQDHTMLKSQFNNIKIRVAILGNLCQVGYNFAKFLRRKGVNAHLFISSKEESTFVEDSDIDSTSSEYLHFVGNSNNLPTILNVYPVLKIYRGLRSRITTTRLIRLLRSFDLIHSLNGWNYFPPRVGKKYIAFTTGADMTEVAMSQTKYGKRMRKGFQQANLVMHGNLNQLPYFKKLDLNKTVFLPFPIDVNKYHPYHTDLSFGNFECVFFAPSSLDWTYKYLKQYYYGVERVSGKGNDRFLKAFARLLHEGYNALAILVYHGVDKEKTKQLVRALGIASNVRFIQKLRKNEMIQYYNASDVVVDQFDMGSHGLITLEAMSCAKPVIVSIRKEWELQCYPEPLPIINCRTENEIYRQLKLALKREYREKIGAQAREWIMKYHHWEKVIDKLIRHYETILGRKII